MSTPISDKTGFVTAPTSDETRPASGVNEKTGFVNGVTQGQQKPVRPSQPVGGGAIATANAGKASKKQVKG